MKQTNISKGGQISIPARVRHRWGTGRILIEDRGDALLIRPVPADPVSAAIGSLAGRDPNTDELRARVRDEESAIDERRRGRP